MFEPIEALDIYNKNVNILIGSGASADLFPTLGLQIRDAQGNWETIETLSTKYALRPEKNAALFMHYYNTCIHPVQTFTPSAIITPEGLENLEHYEMFLRTLLGFLDRRKDANRKINIFTTNYDGCLAHAADRLLVKGVHEFVVNDGTSGFYKKHLHAKNFNTFQCQTGVFERAAYGVPQLNIIHLHGSVYWAKSGEKIEVNYKNDFKNLLSPHVENKISEFSNYLVTKGGVTDEVPFVKLTHHQMERFWYEYNKLPIVNPTKWKFHETVFEEHYYQMLRLLSYELERPNSILITFGFSFADEHILKLVQRSLSNPKLQTFVCAYSQQGAQKMRDEFGAWRNVKVIGPPEGADLNFAHFNKYVLSLSPQAYEPGEAH